VIPDGYAIRELVAGDGPALAAAYRRNRVHLQPWDPWREESYYLDAGQAAAIVRDLASVGAGQLAAFVTTQGDAIVGRVNLNNLIMGVLRSASVGYWVDEAHLRKGLATASVRFAVEAARKLGLHRVEAGTLVHNSASQGVLRRCGFEQYGVAPKFLFINGAWQDHNLYQLILHDDPI
jgi:[ribosomal protein S5]-alanine N-acetyltransferase